MIAVLMDLAIEAHLSDWLDPGAVALSHSIMGLDTQLVEDQTYFLINDVGSSEIVGCGGWSQRATLFGGDHTSDQRRPTLLEPGRDAARVRAMYTHPAHKRRGIGRYILTLCETAARNAGFDRVELMATISGKPLYEASGYTIIEPLEAARSGDTVVPGWRMGKPLI